jgi:uncharacterized membrane protein YebE (DUF533 family)
MLPTRPNNENAKMNRTTLVATLLLATTAVASAHDRYNDTSNIDGRRASEMRRIENGRRSGQLTWREYRFLRYEQARIAADEHRAKADGYVSHYERRRLNQELDQASRDIYQLKHNDRVAWWRRWRNWE